MTKSQAVEKWINGFNVIKKGDIIADDWQEITLPATDDRVYVYDSNSFGHIIDIIDIIDEPNNKRYYIIELDNGKIIQIKADSSSNTNKFRVERDDIFPLWDTMWSFGNIIDDKWIEGIHKPNEGLKALSACGFRVYKSNKHGKYIFGIDGGGYNFYKPHWLPLYELRGLQWHDYDDTNI